MASKLLSDRSSLLTISAESWQAGLNSDFLQKLTAIALALLLHGSLVATLLIKADYDPPIPISTTSFEFVTLPTTIATDQQPKILEVDPIIEQPEVMLPPPIEPIDNQIQIPVQPSPPPLPPVAEPLKTPMPIPSSAPRRKPPPKIKPEPTKIAPEPAVKKIVKPTPEGIKTASKKVVQKPVVAAKPDILKAVTSVARQRPFTPPIGRVALLNNPKPVYPRFARRRGLEGLVLLSVEVDSDGHPLQVKVKQGSGYSVLDRSALQTVKKWRFIPAKRGGIAVRASVEVPIRFSLLKS
jgi:periplasmic protein TonB